ncbi:MAG: hydrogenase expression/formation protein HypE [Pirellulales bacterium]|nr:hydrogenase expression/formation protein HypE [Pirellulales bacterium]
MRRLIRESIAGKLSMSPRHVNEDSAALGPLQGDVFVTTDSYVVSPLFFPGGDIGSLAVHGTVNDLAMAGAQPRHLTLSLILEEGLPLETLDRVIQRIQQSAAACQIEIVAGDTKVVPRGACDGMFINTTGIGTRIPGSHVGVDQIQGGDRLLVSGPIAQHGFAVLTAREGLKFAPEPHSDSKPLHPIAADLIQTLGPGLHAMRDATRGGVAAVLHEWAQSTHRTLWIDQQTIPLLPECRGVSELLGIDPLLVACEGTFIAAVDPSCSQTALDVLRRHQRQGPAIIGQVRPDRDPTVLIQRGVGSDQPLDEPVAAMLPRIC